MEPTLLQILDAREERVRHQRQLLEQYGKPLLCFTMNIPGPVKLDRDIAIGFYVGCRLLEQSLGKPLHFEENYLVTGCECYCVADMPARELKALALELEDMGPVGRLFDMDVLDTEGRKLSREDLGKPRRKCLLCDRDAYECASTRAHSLEELTQRTGFLLYLAARQYFCEYIAVQAFQALLKEVNVTPKPGLVDRSNSGSHRDMDIRHFFASAQALRPYFCKCAETGFLTRDRDPAQVLKDLRPLGLEAEQTMYKASFGANTHKGAIFSLGIFCALAGRLSPDSWSPEAFMTQCAKMCAGITRELTEAQTAGGRQFAQFGITGVRGEAEGGFRVIWETGLPVLRQGLDRGLSENDALAATLLHLIAATDDTNLIHRGGRERQLAIRQELTQMLEADPYPALSQIQELDERFIRENLSPGGSADLLALTCFVHSLLPKNTNL